MKKALLLVLILFVSVLSTACINNLAVQELNNKAKDYLDSGDYQNAISRLKSSIDLDSTIFESHYNLGIAYTQAEDYAEAVKSFENAIKLKPSFADTYYSLAVAQENYAKDIADGTINAKANKDNKTDKDDDDDEVSSKDKYKPTDAEKAQIAQLFTDSVKSYNTYLEKNSNATDKDEITEKIEYLQTQIAKYSDSQPEE